MSGIPRILIVEESSAEALRLQEAMLEKGWEAQCADTALDALERLDSWSPDMMVVGISSPGVRGDEMCRCIRMNTDRHSIPIVVHSADEDQGVEVKGRDGEAAECFKKSVDTQLLVQHIQAMLVECGQRTSLPQGVDPSLTGARILVVDNSQKHLAHLAKLLADEGYDVEAVAHGWEALQRLRSEDFDCVLVDLVMPQMDGIELCRHISSMDDRANKPIAVLTLTGRERTVELARALEAGAYDFVAKSSGDDVLKGRIRALLRRKFLEIENQRILEELKNQELDAAQARAEKEADLARAAEERRRQIEEVARQLQQAKAKLERSNEDLVQSNDELRQFAFLASHDLQEPLRSITSFCNLLKDSYIGRLDQQADDFIERIVSAAKRMKAMVQGLLSYSRVTRGEHDSIRQIDLRTVLEDALEDLRLPIEESQAEFSWETPPTVFGNPCQLTQMFENLIANAIRYCEKQPPKISIEFTGRQEHWEVAVRDNGIGIAPEHRERIFELFKRLHVRDENSGTGIGLTICKKIAQRHGGTIWVESELGKGSTFRFTIAKQRDEGCGNDRVDHHCASVGSSAG